MEKTFITWEEYKKTLDKLVYSLSTLDKFDYVTGIPRGGLPIAVYVSHQLGIPMVGWDSDRLIYHATEALSRVVVCDDILETGKTAKQHDWLLRRLNVTLAVLINKSCPVMDPDVYGAIMPDDKWIVFPYEKEKR